MPPITQVGSLRRDDNDSPVMGGTSSADNITIVNSSFDPATRRLLVSAAAGTGTVTSVSVVTANGVSGSVATATTTPAITLTLGAITPTAISGARITKRVLALSANSGAPTYSTDSYDVIHITGQTAAINLSTNKTGTPVDGDTLRISITGTGSVGITMGAGFEASTVPLPTTTVGTARLDIGCFWNTETSLWRVVSVA